MRNIGKQLYSTYVGCIQRWGKGWSGYEISRELCRMGGVGTRSTPDRLTVYNPLKSSVAAYQFFSFLNLKMANEKGRNM